MNKVKEFYAKHKKKIIIGGCVVGGAIIGSLITKGRFKMKYGDLRGKMGIIWEPENKFINLEKAKEILDLNVDNASRFAIYKQKSGLEGYACIVTDYKEFIDPTII